MNQKNLNVIFGKFAGQEVPMIERVETQKIVGQYTVVELADKNDPVIAAMEKAARDNGLTLRVAWPGIGGTDDICDDRVNASIKKGADGKWRVSSRFYIG